MAECVVQEGKTLNDLEKEITCSVCQEHYIEPKVLPCLHYYCKECILKLALRTDSRKSFSCPKCCKETTLPNGGVEELKTAFFINHLRSNYFALERVHSKTAVRCEGCYSRSKAEAFCCHCAVFICKECVTSHKKMIVFSSHKVASLEDLKQGRAKQIAVAEPATKKCTIHEEPLLIYCFDCNSLICRDCTVITHREHNCQFSTEAAPEIKKSLFKKLVPFKKVTAELASALNLNQTTKHKIEAHGKSVITTIETSFKELHHILEERKNKLIQEVLSKVEERIDNLLMHKKELSQANTEVQSIVEYTEKCLGHCSDSEVMSMHIDLRRQIQKEIEKHSESNRSFGPVEEADFDIEVKCGEALQQLCQTKTKITQLALDPTQCMVRGEGVETAEVHQPAQVALTTRLSNNKTTSRNTVVVSELKSLYDGSVIKCNVVQSGPGEYRIQYTPTVRGRHELTVSVDGQQVAGSPFPVFVTISPTQLGKPVKVWRDIKEPRCVTTNSVNDVIVAEEGDIIKLHMNGKKTVLVKHTHSKLKELNGVATDSEDNIYCTDFESNKIMKCEKNGGNVQMYKVQLAAGRGQQGVAVIGDEVMLCECGNKGTVTIYNRELKYKRRIKHYNGGEFCGVCADIHGNICVSDLFNNCVRVFSNDGVYLRSIGCDSNGIERVNWPSGVCVSCQYVYVTNCFGHNVSVFTTGGDYITSLGQEGDGESDLTNPCGVCVDKDGFIYVADFGNNRVKCF